MTEKEIQEIREELHKQVDLIGTSAYEIRVRYKSYTKRKGYGTGNTRDVSLRTNYDLKQCKINHGYYYVEEYTIVKTDIFQGRLDRYVFTDKIRAERLADQLNILELHELGVG